MSLDVAIRPEHPGDEAAIRRVHDAAFGQTEEGEIVDSLRQAVAPETGDLWISLVAETVGPDPTLVGHILFTEVTIHAGSADGEVVGTAAGLAPMAVLAGYQRRGAGTRLVEAGLVACRLAGRELVIVLGHPEYYPRFGFTPAADLGLSWEHEAPSEAFLALELTPEAAEGLAGTVRYRPEFG